ncbi:hypothetical protein H0H81_004342 [Sphagnurus paluster]|uniref:Uncharacterized protein n=1 Tax=Sphagnurus paluster TaxID=117069 RepID=A0A9P7FMY2_9AGAR|nr:hypothetical protein H0H81_004342 [Sphagnurus paluster]
MEDTPVSKTLEDSQAQYANDSYFSMFITAGDDIVMEDMLVLESVGVEDTEIQSAGDDIVMEGTLVPESVGVEDTEVQCDPANDSDFGMFIADGDATIFVAHSDHISLEVSFMSYSDLRV